MCYIESKSNNNWAVTGSISLSATGKCIVGDGPFVAVGNTIKHYRNRKLAKTFKTAKSTRLRYKLYAGLPPATSIALPRER